MAQCRPMRTTVLHLAALVACFAVPASALADRFEAIEANISVPSLTVPPGQAILMDFTLRNTSDEPVTLTLSDTAGLSQSPEGGLPLCHVFSGAAYTGLVIRGAFDRTWTDVFDYQLPAAAPELVIAPQSIVGITVDITKYYPPLRTAGEYRIVWQPYGGLITSNQVLLRVETYKEAMIATDEGTMRLRFCYDLAPQHVDNFIELARSGFYNQKTIHRISPGFFLQGGCPNGDGTGIRHDGRKLKAEFSNEPVDRGTVCMARLESDPDSASCQFLIAYSRIPAWDGRYTVFADLVGEESFKTLDKLMNLPVEDVRTGKPQRSVYIRDVRIVDAPRERDAVSSPVIEGE